MGNRIMAKSKIEWTEMTWNPVTGCTKISDGCLNCYAAGFAKRLKAMGNPRYVNGFNVTLHEDLIDLPRQWTKPRKVFVNSMSDLFHKDVPDEFILKVFKTMNECPQHQFQVLTKRPERFVMLNDKINWTPNIWLGVTVESNQYLDRIDYLRNTNACVKFISAEPLLSSLGNINLDGIDWLIVGGESGHHSRPIEEEWVIQLRDVAKDKDVAFFFKQWGGFNKKKNGKMLQGKIIQEYPNV